MGGATLAAGQGGGGLPVGIGSGIGHRKAEPAVQAPQRDCHQDLRNRPTEDSLPGAILPCWPTHRERLPRHFSEAPFRPISIVT